LAKEVDNSGRAVLMTTHRELAELKREQVIAYGSDIRIAECKGSMSAIIEPAA
jgi:ATP-dependent Clp protease adaptor protein ClpS